MNIDINGFGEKLSSYTKKSHENKSLETIRSELKTIFKENGINDSNFAIVSLAVSDGSTELSTSSTSTYIDKLSKKIFDKAEKEKAKKEGREPDKKEDKTAKPKKKPILSFDLASLGKAEPEEIEDFFKRKFMAAGYTEEDLSKPNPNFKVLDFKDKGMDLNIDPSKSFIEQLAECVKKMYKVMINGESLETVKNSNDLHTQETQTSYNLDLPGNEFDKQGTTNTDTPDVKVDFYKNKLDIDNNPDNALTEEDKAEIEQFGIDGIKTHAEMEEFRQSEEYEQLQQMMTNSLSKHDDSDQV